LVELSTQYLTLALPTVPHRGAFKIKINLAPFKKKKSIWRNRTTAGENNREVAP
jgi:hypothetical protein